MTKWRYRVNVKSDWQAAKDGDLTIQALASRIAPKFKGLPVYEQDAELLDLVGELEDLACDPNADTEDFDYVWDQLYDWADQPVEGGKMCWIGTF